MHTMSITLPKVPVHRSFDVIVIGGGPAGCAAALAAARGGAKTLLVESGGALGGNMTTALVTGRSVSCDQYVQGAIRTMPCASNLGEAVGTAAAMMVAGKLTDTREVDIARLRADLLAHGAYLPEARGAGVK